ncbi:hypothetical protein HYH02_010415 [Chlamydomonas schloesseri]|uniref:F-box domain-containing protein n=1 Tax=Chlamydomonas schloesseri TaxID=2026947 RepID=A0A835TBC4_9CHLO|nr:hypothetical protein HYH02_010415 [Chlamydomonas schloesseri]|eukprot:KAG2440537.1 hypothetical protein HYH02_010415 [Chlamydomonas schloesseri]
MFTMCVAARCFAAIHDAQAGGDLPPATLHSAQRNILKTLFHIQRLASAKFASEEDDKEEADNDFRCMCAHVLAGCGRGAAAADPTAAASLAAAAPPPASPAAGASPSPSPSPGPAQQQQHPLQPLPEHVAQGILSRLDARALAVAGAACRALRAATAPLFADPLPPAFVGYLAALQTISYLNQEQFMSDGSGESAFAAAMPLDASPVAGADLTAFEKRRRRVAHHLPDLEGADGSGGLLNFLRLLMPPPELQQPGKPKTPEEAMRRFLGLEAEEEAPGGGGGGGRGGPGGAGDGHVADAERPAPHPLSCRLASFRNSVPVPLRPPLTPRTDGGASGPATATATAGTSTSRSNSTRPDCGGGAAAAPAAAAAVVAECTDAGAGAGAAGDDGCVIATARCDLDFDPTLPDRSERFHVDGNLLAVAFSHGYKQRDPGLGALEIMTPDQWRQERERRQVARRERQRARQQARQQRRQQQGAAAAAAGGGGGGDSDEDDEDDYLDTEPGVFCNLDCGGFFEGVGRVCADAANGLMWAGGDDGRRIKGFRAPARPTVPGLMGCNDPEVRAEAAAASAAAAAAESEAEAAAGEAGPSSTAASAASGIRERRRAQRRRQRAREEGDAPPRYGLQYTLNSDVKGLGGRHAGVHVVGSRVVAVKACGAVLEWDLAGVPPQQHEVRPMIVDMTSSSSEESEDGDGNTDGAKQALGEGAAAGASGSSPAHKKNKTSSKGSKSGSKHKAKKKRQQRQRDRDAEAAAAGRFRCSLGWRDMDSAQSVEGSVGRPPDAVHLLPQPVDAAAKPLGDSRYGEGPKEGADRRAAMVSLTLLLGADDSAGAAAAGGAAAGGSAGGAAGASPWAGVTLVAALDGTGGAREGGGGLGGNMILTWDMDTKRVRNRFFGHLYQVEDLAAAPPECRQQHLFASCARNGDVKIWDTRSSGGGAAITLTNGGTGPLSAVCLVASSSGGGGMGAGGGGGGGDSGSSGGGGGAVGVGMLCFAGGATESIWCWDLRRGAARPLYELSTGNTNVRALAWHPPTGTLLAALDAPWSDRLGHHSREDWMRVRVTNVLVGGEDEDEEEDEDDEEESEEEVASEEEAASEEEEESESEHEDANSSGGGSEGNGEGSGDGDGDGGEDAGEGGPGAGAGAGAGNGAGNGARNGAAVAAAPAVKRWWPRNATHRPEHFPQFWSLADGCVLRYRFWHGASQKLPPSQRPDFDDGYGWL